MTRRHFLFACPVAALAQEAALPELLERLGSALSEGDLALFRSCFDESMPGYEQLVREAKGLMEQNDVSTTIEVLKQSEGEAEVDWTLVLKARAVASSTTERRKVVKLKWKRHRKSVRITSLDPADWFAPPVLK